MSISVSNANLVCTEPKPPLNVFSKILITLIEVRREIITLERSLWIHLLKVLAELHILGLNLNTSCINLFSNNSAK